jgi:PBP1b-binding outer membrane lipoprotein LpoB
MKKNILILLAMTALVFNGCNPVSKKENTPGASKVELKKWKRIFY